MQTEVNHSNDMMFENEFCQISAEGALKQKDNSIFTGKILEEGITPEQADEKRAHYEAAFEKLSADISKLLDDIPDGISSEETEKKKSELTAMLADSEAIGDFNALSEKIHERLSAKAAQPQPVADAPEDENLASDVAEAINDVEKSEAESDKKDSDKAEEPVASEEKPEEPETTDKEAEAESETKVEAEAEKEITPETYYRNLVKEAKETIEIKNLKNASSAYDQLKTKWVKGPEFDHVDFYKLKEKFEEVEKELDNRRIEHQKQQEERKKKNLALREELLDRIQKLIDQKKWSAQGELANLTRKFENIKPLPPEGLDEQVERLKSLTATFEENRVDYLVEVREKEQQNLMGKLLVIEKTEALVARAGADITDWKALNDEAEQLQRDWKKIGNVPREKEDEIWGRFHKAREEFEARRMEHDAEYGKEIEKNIARREKLIERAEKLLEMESLAEASREINHLHSEWKKSGTVPQQTHDDLWNRFKAASDEFNKVRDSRSDEIREEEQRNLEIKEDLIAQAEKLSEQEDWRGSKKMMDKLHEQWKKTGPVPRKKSRALWRNFRKAMDNFYKERRKHFREVREEQTTNLKAKRAIVEKIKELSAAEDIEAAHDEVKKLQEEYKSLGFVPIKQKDKIWDQYHAACDAFFNELRSRGSKSSGKAPRPSASPDKKISGEIFHLRKEIDALRDQVLKYADTKTYFKPNKKGQKLIDEIQGNIDQAEAKMQEKEKRINELQRQLEESRSGSGDQKEDS